MSKSGEKKAQNEEMQQAVADAIREGIKEGLPVATMAAAQVFRGPQAAQAAPVAGRGLKCSKCGQQARACKSQHRLAVVFPKISALADLFPGIRINGVTYISAGPEHQVIVPLKCDIENQVAQWEDREVINMRGRRKQRKSGHLSPNGASINPEPVGF